MSNFWGFLYLSLINCEIKHDLKWTKNCVLIEEDNLITGVSFIITNTKLYDPVVKLYTNDNIELLENIKQGLKGQLLGININLK